MGKSGEPQAFHPFQENRYEIQCIRVTFYATGITVLTGWKFQGFLRFRKGGVASGRDFCR